MARMILFICENTSGPIHRQPGSFPQDQGRIFMNLLITPSKGEKFIDAPPLGI